MTVRINRVAHGAAPKAAAGVFVSCSAVSFTQAGGLVTFPYNSKFAASRERAMARALQWAEPRGILTIYVEDAPPA